MAFDIDLQHWPTLEAFVAHLQTIPRPPWVEGVVDHNTYRPDETQWQGRASMRSMAKVYESRGWSAGPHLFLAAEAPNAKDRGIWQLTPLTHKGVHAGPCNARRIGIENVGDFQARPPTATQWRLAVDVNAAICKHWRLPASQVLVHKECMAGRVCPGQYFDAQKLRADVHHALIGAPPPPPPIPVVPVKRYTVKTQATAGATIRSAPARDSFPLGRLRSGAQWEGQVEEGKQVTLDGFGTSRLWVRDAKGRYVWYGLLDEVKDT